MQPMPQNRSTRNTSIRRQTSDSYSALTREQQIQSDNSYNNYLAYIGQMHYQMRKGEEKGFEKGRKEGKISIARSMKADSMPIETIAKYSVSQSTKSMNSTPLKNTLIYIEREREASAHPPSTASFAGSRDVTTWHLHNPTCKGSRFCIHYQSTRKQQNRIKQ